MAAVFLANARVQSPIGWTRETVDQVLFEGDKWYIAKRQVAKNPYLTAEETAGVVPNCFGGVDVDLKVDMGNIYYGYFNKAKMYHHDSLPKTLDRFIHNESVSYAIFTGNGYSMGLFKDESHVYMYDSHSRGPSGIVARDGTACLVKIPLSSAASKLSYIIHRNCQPNEKQLPKPAISDFQYSVTCFT